MCALETLIIELDSLTVILCNAYLINFLTPT